MGAGNRWICASILVAVTATIVAGARIRPNGDPRTDRVIWADPFDNYSQWAYDNRNNAAYQPNGTVWQGGPMPAGSPTGIYPYKSDNGTSSPNNGCGVVYQELPSLHLLARQQWTSNNCPGFNTPAGFHVGPSTFYAGQDNFKAGTNCGSGGFVETIAEFGRVDCVWQAESGYYTSLGIFTHDLAPRIQSWTPLRAWDQANSNAVQGTDEHPLTLVVNLHDSGNPANGRAFINDGYVELNLDDEHAPTDYIWRGKRDKTFDTGDIECCPEGPYPIICQQVREVNEGNYEAAHDLDYLNTHCPSVVPPYDANTQTGKTWKAIAFGFLAVADKDPCKCAEQGVAAHLPQMNHAMFFDGNVWRELRPGRGTALTECPPSWGPGDPTLAGPETTMQDSGGGTCGDFTLGGGSHKVYLKITTNKILIWMFTQRKSGGVTTDYNYCGAFDRVYKGPFNRVAVGVGPGCEMQDKAVDGDSYTCKSGGTPKRCLTYSSNQTIGGSPTDGFWRVQMDAMSLLDGQLVYNSTNGACCMPNQCLDNQDQAACTNGGGVWGGTASTCATAACQGACCLPDSQCSSQPQAYCTNTLGGTYGGNATTCANATCCPHGQYVWADHDADHDVDMDDFAAFQRCYTGSQTGLAAGCVCFDRGAGGAPVQDNKVDFNDFTAFSNCVSGPSVPWSLANTPSCVP